jgi:hypothetical protein
MENKKELFDLKREKRELDAFLSTIAEPAASLPIKGLVQTKEALSALAENKSLPEAARREPSGLELEMAALKLEEAPVQPNHEDETLTPADNEFIPKFTDPISLKPAEKNVPGHEKMPSLTLLDEGKKTEALPQITDAQGAQPQESYAMLTQIDETTKSDRQELTRTSPPEEKKILTKPVPEKKTDKAVDKANAYDFAPEKKSAGIGKRIWILIILLLALLIGYFWFYPERGSKTIESIKSYIPISKTGQGDSSSSVKGINLMNIREKLVYNTTLGKNVRVIEGIAENSTPRPVSKIRIVANLYNTERVLLASTESFCGNIIIDEKLESLDANGIISALKDVKTMEDRIQPKGQIPFMIVFTSEPAGVFRLSVLPVDFKKH